METAVAKGFAWRETAAGRILVCPALEAVARHAFTTRQLAFRGASEAADFARLGEALGVPAAGLVTVRQVHGRDVLVVREGTMFAEPRPADAIVCTDPARAIAVRVADCVPILLADRSHRVVAAIHAGWRGTASGIVHATIDQVVELGVPASELTAAIGPSIGSCCYQVDDKVRTTFLGVTPDAAGWFQEDGPGHWRLDLWQANADQLEDAGVPAGAIHRADLCTKDAADVCFSYRRDGEGTGRLVAAIRLKTSN